jgi:peptidoglycan/xylan/chitin deacetylase (PgdA/CDA1 family)
MVRGFIKAGFASAVCRSHADRLVGAMAGRRYRPMVFGYHRVVDDFATHAAYSIPPMLTSRAMFERHLEWIAGRFAVVRLEDLALPRAKRARPAAAITFDDGYRDVYEQAFPLLTRKGIPATVFVVTEFVGSNRTLLHDRLYLLCRRAFAAWASVPRELADLARARDIALPKQALAKAAWGGPLAMLRLLITTLSTADLRRLGVALENAAGLASASPAGLRSLTWDEVAEMSRAGITIGSHTRSHPLLTSEAPGRVLDETSGSRAQLEERLGRPVRSFAYPDGRFDRASVRAVATAGYSVAVTTCTHRDPDYPQLTIPRLMLWERSSVDTHGRFSASVLSCQLSGAFGLFSACRQRHDDRTSSHEHDVTRHTALNRSRQSAFGR